MAGLKNTGIAGLGRTHTAIAGGRTFIAEWGRTPALKIIIVMERVEVWAEAGRAERSRAGQAGRQGRAEQSRAEQSKHFVSCCIWFERSADTHAELVMW